MYQQVPIPALFRIPGLFPGQQGVPGSDSPFGIRMKPRSLPIFVDPGHNDASDTNDGTNPDAPMSTIAAAVAAVSEPGSQIFVMPGAYIENVATPDSATGPNYCEIIGLRAGGGSPSWASTAAATIPLTINALGWRVTGFRFLGPTTESCIVLTNTGNNVANFAVIDGNHFYGQNTGLSAIDLRGSPNNVVIANNWIDSFAAASGIAIRSSAVATADPLFIKILNNFFLENDTHIDADLDKSVVLNNIFENGAVIGTVVDISGGSIGENVVHGNLLPGDYSNTGGYTAGTADVWTGNFADDVLEAEVGDNGLTVAVPAA